MDDTHGERSQIKFQGLGFQSLLFQAEDITIALWVLVSFSIKCEGGSRSSVRSPKLLKGNEFINNLISCDLLVSCSFCLRGE